MAQSVNINTSQNVRLNFELASIGDRVLATIIDQAVIWTYYFSIIWLIKKQEIDISNTVFALITLPVAFYHLAFEVFNNGRSPGKMVMKTRVIRVDGSEPHIGDFVIRWLIGLIEITLSNGGFAMVIFLLGGKGQRGGDLAAGTTVAKLKARVTLEDTIFTEAEESYLPQYYTVDRLTDDEIETIKTVLKTSLKRQSVESITLLSKTKAVIQQRLEVDEKIIDDRAFLQRVLKDYSFITGKV